MESNLVFPSRHLTCFDIKFGMVNEVIIRTPAFVKRSFLKGLSPQVQEWVQNWLYNLNLIWWSRDGSRLLPDLKGIRDTVRAKFDMMELMEETLGLVPQTVQPMGGLRWVEPVTQEEVGRPAGICAYCGVKGHYWSQRRLRVSLKTWCGQRIWKGHPKPKRKPPRQVGWLWGRSGVHRLGAKVWEVQSDKRVMFGGLDRMDVDFPKKSKGKETAGPSVPAPGKKKVVELAKCALGRESQIVLSLKEMVTVSPMMAEELILVIWESTGLKADGNHVSFDMWLGEVEPAAEMTPGLHLDTVLCPLGYIQMCIRDCIIYDNKIRGKIGESSFRITKGQNIQSLFPGCSVQRAVTRECLLLGIKKDTHHSSSYPQ
ncbi:hypothetical protein VP01_5359g1 [Puccinia sorghi]|uniref:Uncharacterized protein n=1 Tax=Puccinia sorghi TaxID=27349 RepID=A0A0L6UKU0_9BASI|nr:hypothetical protein VP01_5359g1 [Puccinia sorghi]